MKEWFGVMIVMTALVIFEGVLWAGDYHSGGELVCSQCHVMHYSQSHGYNPDGTGSYISPGSQGPYQYLLRDKVNDLCLICHDGDSNYLDVLGTNSGWTSVRMAGALNRGNISPYYDATGHTLDSTDKAPGGTWTPDPVKGLVCTDCHDPHGRTKDGEESYRNLWRDGPTASGIIVTYAFGTNDTSKDVFEAYSGAYEFSEVNLNEPDSTESGFGKWCKDCHTDFHGVVGGSEIGGSTTDGEFLRHPTAGVDIGGIADGVHSSATLFHTGSVDGSTTDKTNWVKVMSPDGTWYTAATDSEIPGLTPTCLTCHKGHGNKNAFGLIYMENTGTITEEGTASGTYKDLCKQCHVQG